MSRKVKKESYLLARREIRVIAAFETVKQMNDYLSEHPEYLAEYVPVKVLDVTAKIKVENDVK